MLTSLTFTGIAALFAALVVGAAIPGISVLAISARSAASGFLHGAFTAIGIVVGDVVFILVAIAGLSALADAMGSLFVLVKYLGGACLIWMGIALARSKPGTVAVDVPVESSLLSSFLTGLFITLGDQKAILFYLGLLPAFVDLSAVSYFEAGVIVVTAAVAVGGVKLAYAYLGARAGLLVGPRIYRGMNIAAGGAMIAVGAFILARA